MPKLPRLKNPAEFNRAVNRIDEIFLENPGLDLEGDTPEARELDRISDLVIEYEDYFVHIDPPPPGGIIQVQLDQLELDESDLIPILGSRAVVSEVLHGKREVNLQMARALHEHLGIPAEDLLEANQFLHTVDPNPDPKDFPMSEMASAGWFGEGFDVKDWPGGAIEFLMRSAGITTTQHIANVAYRRNDDRRINAKVNPFALQAWCWRVLALTNQDEELPGYVPGTVNEEFMRQIAELSTHSDGPLQAQTRLREAGIALQTVRHLSRTYLDGAALLATDGRPVVGLTLRYDRVDNFWFTLLHELAHVMLHLDEENPVFPDDMSLRGINLAEGQREADADDAAEDALIPPGEWEASGLSQRANAASVVSFAQKWHIHPAIVAGRVRHEKRNFRLLSQFVGTNTIRPHFAPMT